MTVISPTILCFHLLTNARVYPSSNRFTLSCFVSVSSLIRILLASSFQHLLFLLSMIWGMPRRCSIKFPNQIFILGIPSFELMPPAMIQVGPCLSLSVCFMNALISPISLPSLLLLKPHHPLLMMPIWEEQFMAWQ
uniref:Uncharacterized protein n=1 Tax=Opuntia streptacantha TaxID=393608 RepID=A0A7C9EPR6_OPUST